MHDTPRDGADPWRLREIPRVTIRPPAIVLAVASAAALLTAGILLQYPPRVAAALAVCLIGGIGVLLEPYLGVLGYVVLAFLRPQDVFWGLGAERFTLLVSAVTLGAVLLHFVRRPSLSFLARPQNVLVLTLWLGIWLSTQFGKFATPQDKWMDYYAKMFVIYFAVIAVVDTRRKLELLAAVLALSLGYLCWWANEMYFFHGWHTVHGPGGPGDTFYDHNDFAMVMVMVIPLLWFLAPLAPHPLLGWAVRGIIPFAIHGVMVTYSRGGFLGMGLVLLYCAFRERNRWLGRALLAGGVAFFLAFTGPEYRERVRSITGFERDPSAQGRFGAWEAGRAMIADNPVFGVGLKQYLRAFPDYSSKGEFVAHNSWVQLGAECGLPALLSWAGLIGLTGRAVVRVIRRAPRLPGREGERARALADGIGGALLGYLFCGMLLSAEDLEFFYFLVAMAMILDRLTRARARDAVPQAEPA